MAVLYTFSLLVLTLPFFFFFLLPFKKSICLQWGPSCWNCSPLWKSVWFSGCLCAGFRRGRSITGVIDAGCVPFAELQSTSAICLSDDEYIAHLLVCLYFISQENKYVCGNSAATKKTLENYFLKYVFFTVAVGKERNISSYGWRNLKKLPWLHRPPWQH